MAYLFRNKLIKKMLWGRKDFPMAIYHENVHKQRYVKPADILAHLTLNDGTIVDIEDDGTGVLSSAMTSTYKSTCVSAEITTACTEIGDNAFGNCTGLTSVIIPNSVTSIGWGGFGGCVSLASVAIPDSVISIGDHAFDYCTGLTSIIMNTGITTIGFAAFYQCFSLTSVTIPDSVTFLGGAAFQICSSMTSVTVEATTPPTHLGGGFENTNNCPIYVPCESVDAYKAAEGWSVYADRIVCDQPQPVYGGKARLTLSDSSVVEINGAYSPYGSDVLVKNQTSAYSATCVSIEIGSACTTLESSVFFNFTGATSLTIADTVTTVKMNAFAGCSGLTSVVIPDSLTYIGFAMFSDCRSLTSVTIPNSVTIISGHSFMQCFSLGSITIPDSVTTIGQSAFYNCRSLTSVTIPSGVTTIGDTALFGCSGLTSVTVEATTPPTLGTNFLQLASNCPIYVPAASVNTYKTATNWSDYASRIQPII